MSNVETNNTDTVETEPAVVMDTDELSPADTDAIAGAGQGWSQMNHNQAEAVRGRW